MFRILGNFVSRVWPVLLVLWIVALVGLKAIKPDWDQVVLDGEFRYLPQDVPSREGEALFQKAFTRDLLGSSVVIVARRESNPQGLQEQDKQFVAQVLEPWLKHIAAQEGGLAEDEAAPAAPSTPPQTDPNADRAPNEIAAGPHGNDPQPSIIAGIRTLSDPLLGDLLQSEDKKAALVIVELTTEFMEYKNAPTIARIEGLIHDLQHGSSPAIRDIEAWVRTVTTSPSHERPTVESAESLIARLRQEPHPDEQAVNRVAELLHQLPEASPPDQQDEIMLMNRELASLADGLRVPPGLDLAISGSATVGRDMRLAAKKSAQATESTTILLVIILLLLIYRAPILACIPLLTVYVAVKIALANLALLAEAGVLGLFSGIEVYVTVVLYGAGVDFCMFLMARYKEELDGGLSLEEAIAQSVHRVGPAVAASAGTVIAGIGMMYFAQFGKFQEAGLAMSLSLFFVLCAALTFTPSLLRLSGRWAFWPNLRTERIPATSGWLSPTNFVARLMESGRFQGLWERIARMIRLKPATVWLTTVAVMFPFTIVAVMFFDHLSYGLLSELPHDAPSVVGTAAVQQHFPAGATSPVTVLLKTPNVDFRQPEGWKTVEELTGRLWKRKDDLGIADVRSVVDPLGHRARETLGEASSFAERAARKRAMQQAGVQHYVSDHGEVTGQVTRIDIVLREDPFSRNSMLQFDRLKQSLKGLLPAELASRSELYYLGATASIRDLKTVTNSDQIRIDALVILAVFLILVILLRHLAIAGYLILSVLFSYLVTLGVTFAVFWALNPAGFAGLDWKVPMFLFTILVAVGEDYNIYLITRIEEEQQRHGPVEGVTVALLKTGSIISSCGIIMAGTFSSLFLPWLLQTTFGWEGQYLYGLVQLGFALAFGVLLDTFVVRPILVPAYLILLHQGRFGALGRWLGAQDHRPAEMPSFADDPPQQAPIER